MNHISDKNININSLLSSSLHEDAGGLVVFVGTVRNKNKGKKVTALHYEAHVSMANKMINRILSESVSRWKLSNAKCIHRIGPLKLGDTAIVVITSAAHRQEAYEANRYILDTVKETVPIWKKEFFTNGNSEWGTNNE